MSKLSVCSLCVYILVNVQACMTAPVDNRSPSYELLPMYGGLYPDHPKLKDLTERILKKTTKKYQDMTEASRAYSNFGLEVYRANRPIKAMLHFNYAWILDQNNADVYWGYALLYRQQGKHCEARELLDVAINIQEKNPNPMWLADAGLSNVLCVMSDKSMLEQTKQQYYGEADSFFDKAVSADPENKYVYDAWARALYQRGEYNDAWEKVRKQIASGGIPNGKFVSSLTLKIRKPATDTSYQ